jgi:hypothetical protein
MSIFDSNGELHFSWWTDELIKAGYIAKVILQPESYLLSDKVYRKYEKAMVKKTVEKEEKVFREHVYTPDLLIVWTGKAFGIFIPNISEKRQPHQLNYNIKEIDGATFITSTIELKPEFDQNNMTRLAKVNIKWVYAKYGDIIDVVKLPYYFNKTFTPDRYLLTDKSYAPRTIKFKPKTLAQFLNSVQE